MRVLVDSDVVLDLFLERPGFVSQAELLWEAHAQGRIEAQVAPITVISLFYFSRKFKGAVVAHKAVDQLLATVQVCSLNHSVLRDASTLGFQDYEDAVQVAAAMAAGLDAIVTRNVNDYKNSPLPVYSPTDFLARL
jgi:predicted nucleic acid-binding protein